jgi:transposase
VTPEDRIAELEKENAELRRRDVEREGEVRALRETLEKALKELEEWKRGFRERGKRRSSRPEGRRGTTGRRPGRKAGHEGSQRKVPRKIDRTVEYAPPKRCHCGGTVKPTGEQRSTLVEDIPPVRVEVVKHVAHLGCCRRCGLEVSEPLPGDTPKGKSITRTQVGPNVAAMTVSLRFDHHVSLGGIATFFGVWFGLRITAGGVSHLLERLGERAQPAVDEIQSHIRNAPVVGADETGLRQNGVGGWTWIARTETASLFRVELSRGAWVAEQMLGPDFGGVLVTDFYSVYTSHDRWNHAYCGAHMVREAKKIAECTPSERTEGFRDRLCAWYADAKKAQMRGNATIRHGLRGRLGRIIYEGDARLNDDVQRLQTRVRDRFKGITTFLDRRDVPADNNGSERDLRIIARHRKGTGGTRSPRGSQTLGRWMSIGQTRRKNGMSLRNFVIDLYDTHRRGLPPPSVFDP